MIIRPLELVDEVNEENLLMVGDNYDLSGKQPVYISANRGDEEIAIGLTESQCEDLIDMIMDILHQ